jgi:hypothetical protein
MTASQEHEQAIRIIAQRNPLRGMNLRHRYWQNSRLVRGRILLCHG